MVRELPDNKGNSNVRARSKARGPPTRANLPQIAISRRLRAILEADSVSLRARVRDIFLILIVQLLTLKK